MSVRYVLAPEAAIDLVQIWRYIKKRGSVEMADRVEAVIREKIVFLAGNSAGGHWRKDLTDEQLRLATPIDAGSDHHFSIVFTDAALHVNIDDWSTRWDFAGRKTFGPGLIRFQSSFTWMRVRHIRVASVA